MFTVYRTSSSALFSASAGPSDVFKGNIRMRILLCDSNLDALTKNASTFDLMLKRVVSCADKYRATCDTRPLLETVQITSQCLSPRSLSCSLSGLIKLYHHIIFNLNRRLFIMNILQMIYCILFNAKIIWFPFCFCSYTSLYDNLFWA